MRSLVVFAALVALVGLAGSVAPAGDDTAAPDPPSEADLEALVRDLSSPDFTERDAATRRLVEIGQAAVPALRRGREGAPPEGRRRIDRLLDRIGWLAPKDERQLRRLLQILASGAATERKAALGMIAREVESSQAARRIVAAALVRPLGSLEIELVVRSRWVEIRNRSDRSLLLSPVFLRALGHGGEAPEVMHRRLSEAPPAIEPDADPGEPVEAAEYFRHAVRLAPGGRVNFSLDEGVRVRRRRDGGRPRELEAGVHTLVWRLPPPARVRFGRTTLRAGFAAPPEARVLRREIVVFPPASRERGGLRISASVGRPRVAPGERTRVAITLANTGDRPIDLGSTFGERVWLALGSPRDAEVGGVARWAASGDVGARRLAPGAEKRVELEVPIPAGTTGELPIRVGLDPPAKTEKGVFGEGLGPVRLRVTIAESAGGDEENGDGGNGGESER